MKFVISGITNEDLIQGGVLYLKGGSALSEVPTVVGSFAGEKCDNVKILILGDGITKIEDNAFYCSRRLKEIKFSEGLEEIGIMAFYGCISLKELKLPNGLRSVGVKAFDSCDLERVTFPDTVSRICRGAFTNNPNLKEVEVPALCKVDNGAFDPGCVVKRQGQKDYEFKGGNGGGWEIGD